MKKYKRILAYIFAMILILGNVLNTGIVVKAAEFNMELPVGESRYITDYQWVNDGITSSNPTVATAVKDNSNNGQVKITGHAPGTAVISFSHWTGNHTVTVMVSSVAVTGISLSPETINLAVGHRAKAIATFSPSNATNQNLTWTSSDESVASVLVSHILRNSLLRQTEAENASKISQKPEQFEYISKTRADYCRREQ